MANDETTPNDPQTAGHHGPPAARPETGYHLPNRLPIVDGDEDDPGAAPAELTRAQRFRRQLPWAIATLLAYWTALGVATHIPLRMAKKIENGDKLVHAAAYGGLAFCFFVVLSMFRKVRFSSFVIVWVVVGAYGVVDEVLQGYVPYRSPDVKDWIADMIGATAALIGCRLLHGWWTRRRAVRPICQSEPGR